MPTRREFARTAHAARLLSSPTRLRILASLLQAEASVSELASRIGADRYRLSYHLAILRRYAVIQPAWHGRLIVYRIAADETRQILAALERFRMRHLPSASGRAKGAKWRGVQMELQQARTCYDHLGGLAAVYLLAEFLRRRWLVRRRDRENPARISPAYTLTMRGAQALMRRRVNVFWARRSRRRLAYGCPDWSPSRLHLGGALGAAVRVSLVRSGVVRLHRDDRTVVLRRPLAAWLDAGGSGSAAGSR
ncbi:MAG: metalloregulator ArsR/SmtB family transcription factor [Armatimonadota bacterium]|nr:metalloregulator ArsR/SmtB family transcription factor [Armatimonadota bacterium]MDR7427899.1 metalloregulator ArsR/SmtB family transcription factor [Armatimonadota bacterium]MDR7463902.1 metalloregulator ArsR/SmtB family transcription factor [Armatimonadota bacterium]MDR7470072.1 metalloregulator ArsR/SmtB family transcription factor [Armatimonadota bacterium]MDR7474406.1 metalloregulator ArsR/SmtB family transcription factor [Armatimonadota bacterium]